MKTILYFSVNTEVDEEREILFILAPSKITKDIMERVNKDFGITSPANGIIFSVPTQKNSFSEFLLTKRNNNSLSAKKKKKDVL